MTIELIDINKFKEASFPGRWGKIGEDEWGAPTTTTIAPLPPEVGEFHGELEKLVKQANELLLNKQNKSVKELKEGRAEILSEYDSAKRGYPQDKFTKMKVISDTVIAQQIENELNAVIEEKEAANIMAKRIQQQWKNKKKKQMDEKELAGATELEKEKIEEISQRYDGIEASIRQQFSSNDEGWHSASILLQRDRPKIDNIISELKSYPSELAEVEGNLKTLENDIAEAKAKAGAGAEGDKFTGAASLLDEIGDVGGEPPPGGVKVELEKVSGLNLVSNTPIRKTKQEVLLPPKAASTSKCPCDSIKGGGKNKRKKNTKNKRKKNTKNKRKKNTKRKFSTKRKSKKSTKKKKYTKKSTKRKNVRNR